MIEHTRKMDPSTSAAKRVVSLCQFLVTVSLVTFSRITNVAAEESTNIPCPERCSCATGDNNPKNLIVNCTESNLSSVPSFPKDSTEILLQYNPLNEVHLGSFAHLLGLRKLVLHHCNIKVFTADVENVRGLLQLEMLDLSDNSLSSVPMNLPPNLKTLLLSHNSISSLQYNDSFSHFSNLRELFLDHNLLKYLSKDSFQDSGSSMKSLQKLVLNSNQLHLIEGDSFNALSSLTALSLAHNKLTYLKQNVLHGLRQLRHLDVAHNRIDQLEDVTFQDLSSLKYLNLNSNHLRTFPRGLPMLEWLDLSHNAIQVISEVSKPDIYPVEVINLAHNPFRCDCHMLWLKELYDQREYLVKHIDIDPKDFIPSCASPERLAGDTWDLLGDGVFKCENEAEVLAGSAQTATLPVDISTRVGMVTDETIHLQWSSASPSFYGGNVMLQYYVFGHRANSMKHVEMAAAQKEYILKNLRPSTNYVVCIRPRAVTGDRERTPPPPLSLDDCIEVATKQAKPPPLASRFEVMFYYILGMLATFIGIFATIGACAMLYGLWHRGDQWSAKYVTRDESYLEGSTYATDEPIVNSNNVNKVHKD